METFELQRFRRQGCHLISFTPIVCCLEIHFIEILVEKFTRLLCSLANMTVR